MPLGGIAIIKENGGDAVPKTAAPPEAITDLQQLVAKAEKGDTSVLPALREKMDDNPAIWREFGDMAVLLKDNLIAGMVGKDLFLRETMMRSADESVRELAGENPTPLEQLLARRIVIDGLYLHKVESLELHASKEPRYSHDAEASQRRIARAHKRYLHAIKTLAQVRKLLGPTVQVNIAQQQVNVATGGGTPARL